MSTITAPESVLTPEDASAMSGDILYELVDGRLVEKNLSFQSTMVLGNVIYLLKQQAGSPSTAFVLPEHCFTCFPGKPRQMRRPDVALILATRMTAELFEEGVSTIRPDLVVEIVSPNDRVYDLREKLDDYRDAEIPLVWLIYPPTKTVEIFRADGSRTDLGPDAELTGEDVLPGFRCRVADFFVGLPESQPHSPVKS